MDDDLSGIITNIDGSEVTVATTNGFELKFQANELVKIHDPRMMSRSLFSSKSLRKCSYPKRQLKNVKSLPKFLLKERRSTGDGSRLTYQPIGKKLSGNAKP